MPLTINLNNVEGAKGQTLADWATDSTVYPFGWILYATDETPSQNGGIPFKISDGTGANWSLPYVLSKDQLEAILYANAPTISNPFATIADIPSVSTPDLNAVLTAGSTSNTPINSTNGRSTVNFAGTSTFISYVQSAVTSIFTASNLSSLFSWTNGTKTGSVTANVTKVEVSHTDLINLTATSVTKNGSEIATEAYVYGLTWLTDLIWGTWINALTSKTTPVDADYAVIMDSADSNKAKKLSWANLKATLKTYFDTLYSVPLMSFVGGSNSVSSPADGGVVYVGLSTALAPGATDNTRQFKGITGTMKDCYIETDATSTLGSNETATLKLWNVTDGTSAGTIGTFTFDVRGVAYRYSGLSIAMLDTKYYSYRIEYPTFATNPTNVYITIMGRVF